MLLVLICSAEDEAALKTQLEQLEATEKGLYRYFEAIEASGKWDPETGYDLGQELDSRSGLRLQLAATDPD